MRPEAYNCTQNTTRYLPALSKLGPIEHPGSNLELPSSLALYSSLIINCTANCAYPRSPPIFYPHSLTREVLGAIYTCVDYEPNPSVWTYTTPCYWAP